MQNNKVKHNVNNIENSIFRVEMQKKEQKKTGLWFHQNARVFDWQHIFVFLLDKETLQIEQHESSENWGQPMCSVRASSSFSTCASHRVTLVSNPV